ncbi:hypothetical protein BN12_1490018 [Nostocoides japonicum T1-X7]|uniref:Uncharacterized protein n=1 Tax=Nostocoides japonicum T1-X7 TaxID=1194083 RepID=A0A077LTH2_9MICO|nr:hypothetical protein BN12_1490018 [Tetrasphaera japonica T1-X7]
MISSKALVDGVSYECSTDCLYDV